MNSIHSSDLNEADINQEMINHLPQSLQLMAKIEKQAQARLRQIMESIGRGETTLDAVKMERGLL